MATDVDVLYCQIERASEPIQSAVTKIGGMPVFLEAANWPVCKHCRRDMGFLAQINLRSPILFATRYEMAYIFMCRGKFDDRGRLECETWDPYAGANAVLLQSGLVASMRAVCPPSFPDFVVTSSRCREPLVDTSDPDTEESLLEAVSESTKIGGVPAWLQRSEDPSCPACGGSMRFVAQLNAELEGPLSADPDEWNGTRYPFLPFGAAGIGYLFICDRECGRSGAAFLWQCT
jgi:hypothetical protein